MKDIFMQDMGLGLVRAGFCFSYQVSSYYDALIAWGNKSKHSHNGRRTTKKYADSRQKAKRNRQKAKRNQHKRRKLSA